MKMEKYSEYIESIDSILIKINKYNAHVNNVGIWFFLAILGCWGIAEGLPRAIAVVFSFLIFSQKFFSGVQSKTFSKELADLVKSAEAAGLVRSEFESLMYRVNDIKRKKLGMIRYFTEVPAYYLAMIFVCYSIFYWNDNFT